MLETQPAPPRRGAAWARLLGAPWTSDPRVGVALIAASAVTSIVVGFAGSSSVGLRLGPRESLLPPWYLPASAGTPSEWVCVGLLWLGITAGAIGLWIAWRAVAAGWHPDNRKLLWLGIGLSVATAVVLPLTSADVLMYAAYGRLQVIGLDPYDITPAEIFRAEYDPVLRWVERPWHDTPSVYGPLASFSQWAAASLGGENMHDIVFWLQIFSLVPFLVIGVLVYLMAASDHPTQTRAVLFTVLNPLLIWSVIAGAHNEALTVVFAIAGLWFYRRNPFLAGIGIGLAGTVKVSLVFFGIAMAWGYRHQLRKLAGLLLGAALPLLIAYAVVMPYALLAATRNVGYIASGSAASGFHFLLGRVMPDQAARIVVGVAAWLGLVLVGWMLSRVMPWQLVPGIDPLANPRRDPLTIAVRTAVVLTTAWLMTSTYSLSWYDLAVWAPLGLMAASRLESMLNWRGLWLSLAFVTGRALEFGDGVLAVASVLRDLISPVVQVTLLWLVVRWWWTSGRELPSLTGARSVVAPARDRQSPTPND